MIELKIIDDDENSKLYNLSSYDIKTENDIVIVKFNCDDCSFIYKLIPDENFNNVDSINNYLGSLLYKIYTNNYILEIIEFLERMYVDIGYETLDEYECEQFSVLERLIK